MIAAMVSLLANLEYRGHLISVSAIFDAPSQYQLKTPVVQVRRCDSREVLTTILTHHAFVLQDRAIGFGFVLGREWVNKRLSNPRNERRQNLPGWFVAAMKDALIILFGVIAPLVVGLYLIFNLLSNTTN